MSDRNLDVATLRRIVAERRAVQLVRALRNAVAGAPHWRWEATRLLEMIDGDILLELSTVIDSLRLSAGSPPGAQRAQPDGFC